jgi:hypothetical protein
MIAHPFGVVGLGLNVMGTFLLLWFPPTAENYTRDGQKVIGPWAELARNHYEQHEWQRAHYWERRTSRIALSLLALGFVLQGIDLLRN